MWITYYENVNLPRVDPTNGVVRATIRIGTHPAFLAVARGSVWVMASDDGALCQVDPDSDQVTVCTVVEPGGGYGDLTYGNGYVWWGGMAQVVQVDPRDAHVVRRIGLSQGDVSASAGSGQLWISAHDEAKVYRIPL